MAMTKFSWLTLLSLLLVVVSAEPDAYTMINQICYLAQDPVFCNEILEQNLVSQNTDLIGLTKLTINISLSHAQYIQTSIHKLGAAIVRNPAEKQVYYKCERRLRDVVTHITGAKSAADRANYRSMSGQLKSCDGLIQYCDDTIGGQAVVEPNRKMRVLLSMGIYQAQLLQHK